MTPAAVLDLDGTLHPGTLGASVLRELVAAGHARSHAAGRALAAIADRAHTPAATTVDQVYASYTQAVAGMPHRQLREASRRAWDAQRGALFPYVPTLLRTLSTRGYTVVLLSGSPQEALDRVGGDLHVHHCYGAQIAVRDGRCQGYLTRAPGRQGEKLRILNHLAERLQLDLTQSLALGNSASDLSLLQAVGNPVAFEPDAALAAHARGAGWGRVTRDTALHTLASLP
ncbi:haloacid dehalogenase-like hydrolase [Streptomyces sp. NBC_01166]|uniref:HAD family hydrolase n=1 Tax=Streptomyces sp. NBC_01166 TaxID=2903755 RepID=UPI00386A34E9|nr:haloacid dehalogenase-like hydrolase [Streptomyces sp. NBC_01166]